jgi:hypothetical protein
VLLRVAIVIVVFAGCLLGLGCPFCFLCFFLVARSCCCRIVFSRFFPFACVCVSGAAASAGFFYFVSFPAGVLDSRSCNTLAVISLFSLLLPCLKQNRKDYMMFVSCT